MKGQFSKKIPGEVTQVKWVEKYLTAEKIKNEDNPKMIKAKQIGCFVFVAIAIVIAIIVNL